jgi:hypothetical protein
MNRIDEIVRPFAAGEILAKGARWISDLGVKI